jgi:hypothetical protein
VSRARLRDSQVPEVAVVVIVQSGIVRRSAGLLNPANGPKMLANLTFAMLGQVPQRGGACRLSAKVLPYFGAIVDAEALRVSRYHRCVCRISRRDYPKTPEN